MGREVKRVPLNFPMHPTDAQIGYIERAGKPRPSWVGYQMWQTVSDKPYTPTFATAEELARYCANNPWGAECSGPPITQEAWLAFINGPGWALSMVIENGVMQTGVQAATKEPT